MAPPLPPRPLPLPPQAQGIFPEGNPLPLGNMIPAFTEGAKQMQKGGSSVLTIPAEQAYGAEPPPGSPPPRRSTCNTRLYNLVM